MKFHWMRFFNLTIAAIMANAAVDPLHLDPTRRWLLVMAMYLCGLPLVTRTDREC